MFDPSQRRCFCLAARKLNSICVELIWNRITPKGIAQKRTLLKAVNSPHSAGLNCGVPLQKYRVTLSDLVLERDNGPAEPWLPSDGNMTFTPEFNSEPATLDNRN